MAALSAESGADVDRGGKTTSLSEGAARRDGDDMGPVSCGRQTLQVPISAFGETGEVVPSDQAEEAVQDNKVSQTPCMSMEREEELYVSRVASQQAVETASAQGLPPLCVHRLRAVVLGRFVCAFHRAQVEDPPARVEPMIIRRQSGLESVRARPRVYSPENAN